MKISNEKGIFSNHQDTFEGLEAILEAKFDAVEMKIIGHVCLFWAKKIIILKIKNEILLISESRFLFK